MLQQIDNSARQLMQQDEKLQCSLVGHYLYSLYRALISSDIRLMTPLTK